MTPQDALATALLDIYGDDNAKNQAAAVLAALPEGTAIVTVDSLAAALRVWGGVPAHVPDADMRHDAAAIIQAREAER